jgi:hypothetical protein
VGASVRLKAPKGSTAHSSSRCKTRTKAGNDCNAPVVENGLCFFHGNPERLTELGRQGGRKNRRQTRVDPDLPHRSLRSTLEVGALLEETINRIRQVPFDLRSANSIGFLAGILLKALERSRIEERLANLEIAVAGESKNEEGFDFKSQKGPIDDQL